jgi:hypothetical protein
MLVMPQHFLGLMVITLAIVAFLSWVTRDERKE